MIGWHVAMMCVLAASEPSAGESILFTVGVERPARIASTGVTLEGAWRFPDDQTPVPLVVIAGGTMSHTRDGGMDGGGPPGARRDALKRLAVRLAEAGYGSLRWDKRGHGTTPPGPQPTTNEMEADDVAAAIRAARAHPQVTRVIVAGESAGGYFTCMAAGNGVEPDGYVFLGALASPSERMFAHNYGRLYDWARSSADNMSWARAHAVMGLAVGSDYPAMFAAAARGEDRYVIRFEEREYPRSLVRIRTEIAHPPADLFRNIRRPALVLQGEQDMNVPPGDAEIIGGVLRAAGRQDVQVTTIPGADHSFQYVAEDERQRMLDRHGFTSFNRLYHPLVYQTMITWLNERFPTSAPVRAPAPLPRPGIVAWNGIQVIEDITDPALSPGVETLEGRIGPLLKAEGAQAHYIDMPPGLYLHEHTHASESIIYTVRGQWVLCSGERRHLMKPGSLYWFRPGEATGYEVPFDQPAYLLIFKGDLSDWSDAAFWEYLQGLSGTCVKQNEAGEPFLLRELPPDHPARRFAGQVNPSWEQQLPASVPAP